MQTLQIQIPSMYRIIEWNVEDRPTTFRIVDHDNNLIAKVNGPGNVDKCKAMIEAVENCDRMKSLLKNRLLQILKQLGGSSVWNFAIREALEKGKEDQLIKQLKSQAIDSPGTMTRIIGGEALQILQVL